jgi:transmembrane sensor
MSPRTSDDRSLERSELAALWCIRIAEAPLTSAEQDAFAAWLAEETANRLAFEEAAATWREFDGAESAPDFLQMRVEALRELAPRAPAFRAPLRWLATGVAAIVLLIAGIGVWEWVTSQSVYSTRVGERRVAVLGDGSKVSLDAATTVRVRYTADRRYLELVQGRAKFEVAKDPLRPFSVTAANKVIVATGTEFSVERLQRTVRVVLYEGHVAVLQHDSRRQAPQPLRLAGRRTVPADQGLTPGRELVVPDSSDEASVAPIDPARALSWEAGQLVFVNEPLSSAIERVNRYSNEKLGIADASAGQVRVTGVFTAGDIQAFTEGVMAVLPVRVIQHEGRRVFVSASQANG